MERVKRSFLAHFIDAAFDTTFTKPEYTRLGKDLEELSVELNPEVEGKKNILDEISIEHSGYEPSVNTEPFFYYSDDTLSQKILDIALGRLTGEACKTSYVEVVLKAGENGAKPTCVQAWREVVYVIPNSYGGDTTGVQVPFTLHHTGQRVKGTFDVETKTFTAEEAAA